jgi:hypothetical protein
MQVIMLFRPEINPESSHATDPFAGIEIVKVLDDSVDAMEFIDAFEASSVFDQAKKWIWHIEPVKGTYLPPDFSEDLAHPYKGRPSP